ncbi:MAG: DUF21 domain-containing protein, partial [Chloroflexi bacterium]|nr:DUF21 domain-containing protein [Chloroflexota bacterium]
MGGSAFEIVLIVVLMIANGVLAMSETAIVAARRARLQQRANAGDRGARAALEVAESPNQFLSTVQIGITLVGILAGAFGGATIARSLATSIAQVPALAPYSEAIGLVLVVAAITYLSLVIGELVPKRLALNNPERVAAFVARPMQAVSAFSRPVVALLGVSTDVILRVLGVRPSDEPPVTEEEVTILIEQGTRAG